jgi:hypothetical protein
MHACVCFAVCFLYKCVVGWKVEVSEDGFGGLVYMLSGVVALTSSTVSNFSAVRGSGRARYVVCVCVA